jgi:hypothetical protein
VTWLNQINACGIWFILDCKRVHQFDTKYQLKHGYFSTSSCNFDRRSKKCGICSMTLDLINHVERRWWVTASRIPHRQAHGRGIKRCHIVNGLGMQMENTSHVNTYIHGAFRTHALSGYDFKRQLNRVLALMHINVDDGWQWGYIIQPHCQTPAVNDRLRGGVSHTLNA